MKVMIGEAGYINTIIMTGIHLNMFMFTSGHVLLVEIMNIWKRGINYENV